MWDTSCSCYNAATSGTPLPGADLRMLGYGALARSSYLKRMFGGWRTSPYLSLAELKAMTGQRLQLQKRAERTAQAAVTSSRPQKRHDRVQKALSGPKRSRHRQRSAGGAGKKIEHLQPHPKPIAQLPWLSRPSKGRRQPSSSASASPARLPRESTRRTGKISSYRRMTRSRRRFRPTHRRAWTLSRETPWSI